MSFAAARPGGVRLVVHARTGARTTTIVGPHGDALAIRIAAPPLDGRANDELIAFLAERLGVAPRQVRIIAGALSRRKVVDLDGVDLTQVLAGLVPGP